MLGCAALNACTSVDVRWLVVCSVCVYVHVWVSVHVSAGMWKPEVGAGVFLRHSPSCVCVCIGCMYIVMYVGVPVGV